MNNPRQIIAEVAARYIGVREVSPNWSPEIEKFWQATNYPDGARNREPWCAAFACFVLQQADKESPLLNIAYPARSPSVRGWLVWAANPKVGALVFRAYNKVSKPEPGDIMVMLPKLSHIAIVDHFKNGVVYTTEGNTNAVGSREGDRVAAKERALVDWPLASFIRVPAVGERL